MTSIYDEIEFEDLEWEPEEEMYFYPCPCGDRFQISLNELRDGEEIATCPSCSLMIRVIYDPKRTRTFPLLSTTPQANQMPPRRPQRANTGKETSKDKAAGLNRPDESFLSSSQESNLFETSGSDSESIVECEDTPFPMARHRRGRPAGDRMITKNSPKKIKRSIDSNGKLAYKKTTKSKYQKMTDFSLVDNRPHKLSEWQTCLLKTRKIKRRGSERSKNDFSRFLRPPIDITRVRSGLEIFDSKLNNFLTLSDSCIKKHVLESKNNHGSSLHGKNEELHWSLDCELPVVSLDWSCTGKFLFAAITNGEDCVIPEEVGENSSKLSNSMILIWRFINSPNDGLIRKIPISEKFGPAVSIACCPVREDLLIVVCALQTFFINILADENLHHPIDFPHDEGGRITCASWSLDGKYFSLGSSLGFLTLWAWEMNQSHPQIIASLRVTTRPLSSLCFDFQNRIAVGIFGTPAFIIDFFTASMIPKRTPMISSKSLFPVVNYSSLLNIWIIADTEFLCKGFYKISMESNMDYLLQDSSKNEPSVRQSTSFDDTLTKLVLNDNLEPVSADATSNIRRAPPKSPSNRNKKSDREIFEMEIEEKSVWGNCNVGTFTCQISAVGTSNMHSVIATGGCDGSVHLSWLQENVQKDERNFILQVEKNVLSVLPSTGGQSVINTHDPISTKEKNAVKLYPLINAVRSLAWCKSPDFPGILAISTGHKTVHLVSMDRSEFGSSKAGKREAIICALTADSSKRRRIADFETLCL